MLHMMGAKTLMCIFNRDVGIGSNLHSFAGAEAIISFKVVTIAVESRVWQPNIHFSMFDHMA